jgi:glycosyltransferase involved in cell wall biosynthesis
MSRPGEPLRVALLVYRGNPLSGGQGVYTRYLSRELVDLGHEVTVFAGQPWPTLNDKVGFVAVPSLDLYREPDPFRIPWPREFRSWIDVAEFGLMCTAGFPEPLTFSWRVRRALAQRRGQFDLVHDNQCFGRGLLGVMADGWPLIATLHHPITVDRTLDLSHAQTWRRKVSLHRWYGFLGMQMRVARQIPRIVTVSESSKRDIVAQMGVRPEQLAVVPVGVDHTQFRPLPGVTRRPGRLMTTASADVPLKGLGPLLEALAKLRTEHDADLVVIGKPRPESRAAETIERLGLQGAVHFVSGVSDQRLIELYAEASVAVVPSLYEGFSLPAVEAMATGTPLVATRGGAIPEVVGDDGTTAVLVPPGDAAALAITVGQLLDDPARRQEVGAAGRARVVERYSWERTARETADLYREVIARSRRSAEPVRGAQTGSRHAGSHPVGSDQPC